MKNNQDSQAQNKQDSVADKPAFNQVFKNQNPNETHNTKKESCGPNTKR